MEIFARLRADFPSLPAERDFSFARHTTIGCGGTAAAAVFPQSGAETAQLLKYLAAEHIAYCFLGAGADVLPKEGYFEGVVVRFGRMAALSSAGEIVRCGAGVTLGRLINGHPRDDRRGRHDECGNAPRAHRRLGDARLGRRRRHFA